MSKPIADFISDMYTEALIAHGSSIGWLSLPRSDSQAYFAALLGSDQHERWLVAPSRA